MYISRGNHKLSNKIGIWNLPHKKTCIGSGICRNFCYENKVAKRWIHVNNSREKNYRESRERDFISIMTKKISKSLIPLFRIHESGDFYSQEYLNKWIEIAKNCKDTLFIAYTKSFTLDFDKIPKNMKIIQSYGSRFDNKINTRRNTARVITDSKELKKNEYLCPYSNKDFTKCGEYCSYCFSKKVVHVAFLKH